MVDKVFFSAKTQYENLGDGVIGSRLLNIMRSFGVVSVDNRQSPLWYDEVLGVQPQESVRELGVGFKRNLFISALKSRFSSSNVYLALKPGHIFGGQGIVREIAYTLFMLVLFVLGVRIVRYGCSIGPFTNSAVFFEKIKAFCYWDYTARDSLSIDYCKTIGIDKARYSPDMAFGLEYQMQSEAKRYPLALSFRTGTTTEHESAYTEKLEQHLLSSKFVTSRSQDALFISQVKRDDQYISELKAKLSNQLEMLTFTESYSSQESIFTAYKSVEMVLSNRLHVLLFAASQGAIPIALVERQHHKKIVGIFEDVGLEELIFDLDGSETLDDKIEYVYKSYSSTLIKVRNSFIKQSELLGELSERSSI